MDQEQAEHKETITLVIVYGKNKPLDDVKKTEAIEKVKVDAMGLFGIPSSEHGSYILKTKVKGQEEQLDEAKTVGDYGLHNEQKVTLAAGTPFGAG